MILRASHVSRDLLMRIQTTLLFFLLFFPSEGRLSAQNYVVDNYSYDRYTYVRGMFSSYYHKETVNSQREGFTFGSETIGETESVNGQPPFFDTRWYINPDGPQDDTYFILAGFTSGTEYSSTSLDRTGEGRGKFALYQSYTTGGAFFLNGAQNGIQYIALSLNGDDSVYEALAKVELSLMQNSATGRLLSIARTSDNSEMTVASAVEAMNLQNYDVYIGGPMNNVPEPSSAIMCLISLVFLLRRRSSACVTS